MWTRNCKKKWHKKSQIPLLLFYSVDPTYMQNTQAAYSPLALNDEFILV